MLKIEGCPFEELMKLYQDAEQQGIAGIVNNFASNVDTSTFRVNDDKNSELIITIAFCDSGDRRTDLVVVGFATDEDIEKNSSTLENFLNQTLCLNSEKDFDIISFPCLNPDENDPLLISYSDKQELGYRPIIHTMYIQGVTRVRFAHDAKAFKDRYILKGETQLH